MNYGKKSASKKRNSLISRSSMMGKRAHVSFIRVLFIGLIALCVAVSSLGIGSIRGILANTPDVNEEMCIRDSFTWLHRLLKASGRKKYATVCHWLCFVQFRLSYSLFSFYIISRSGTWSQLILCCFLSVLPLALFWKKKRSRYHSAAGG